MDSEEEQIDEFILSVCWDSGILAASYFNLATLELHVRALVFGISEIFSKIFTIPDCTGSS